MFDPDDCSVPSHTIKPGTDSGTQVCHNSITERQKKRIVFLAIDDQFAGAMQKPIYESHPDWIVGTVISTCAIYKRSKIGAAWFLFARSGSIYILAMVKMKLLHKISQKRKSIVPSRLAKPHNVEIHYSSNINSAESLDKLSEWHPDVIISTNFNHYIGRQIRMRSTVGTWNLHKSLLPHYRGMGPNFYALLEGAKSVGATLHVVDDGYDTGHILKQTKVQVHNNDSVHTLNANSANKGGQMLRNFLETTDLAHVQASPQPEGNWKTYSYPTRSDIRKFRKKSLSF